MSNELSDVKKIQIIEITLNTFLIEGKSPPRTSEGLMKIFDGCGDKDEIIRWFNDGKIKWIKDMKDPTPNTEYHYSMNSAMVNYLTNT
jgi:hypothetical protein